MTKTLKIAMLGFGNAGKAFAKLLMDKHGEIIEKYKYDIQVVAISTNSRGCLVNRLGIDLGQALSDMEIFTGQPAIDHIKTALNRKKHAITANKGPIACA